LVVEEYVSMVVGRAVIPIPRLVVQMLFKPTTLTLLVGQEIVVVVLFVFTLYVARLVMLQLLLPVVVTATAISS